jgi:hypothetical protein
MQTNLKAFELLIQQDTINYNELVSVAKEITSVKRVDQNILIYVKNDETKPLYQIQIREGSSLWIEKRVEYDYDYYRLLVRVANEPHLSRLNQVDSTDSFRVFLEYYLQDQVSELLRRRKLLWKMRAQEPVLPKELVRKKSKAQRFFGKILRVLWPIGITVCSYFHLSDWLRRQLKIPAGQSIFKYPY